MKWCMSVALWLALLSCHLNPAKGDEGWSADPGHVAKLSASRPEFNYDESRVPEYSLPDPLLTLDGNRVNESAQWPARREETLNLFRVNVYGRRPDLDYRTSFQVVAEKDDLFELDASGRSVTVTISAGNQTFSFPMLVFMPSQTSSTRTDIGARRPALIHINNRKFPTFEQAASTYDEFWPVRDLVERGYIACAISTVTIDPDRADGFEEGVRGFFHRTSGHADKPPADDAWKALSAWGWGASRALDYLLTLDQVDASKVAVIGHSRGGKASLWAAAEDPRFAVAYSNNSGCGGAALSRRQYGETVARITRSFPHWFCDRFTTYANKESTLPVDQHQLLGLLAPRAVYVASAADDLWADPRGEYLSMVAAASVYRLLGENAFGSSDMPAVGEQRVEGKMGYHIRSGGHGLTAYDWGKFMDFCDAQWQR